MNRSAARSKINTGGFTLVEVLVAMAIMAGGIMILANAWSGNFARIKNARINNTMAALLERKMVETEIYYKDKQLTEIKDEDHGDFGATYPGYTWEMKSQDFEMPNMTGALSAKEGGIDQTLLMIIQAVTDFIKQSVKEVSVTVVFKPKSGREIKHTVTTYFVDYTKELPIPGIGGGAAGGDSGTSATGADGTRASGTGAASGGGK
jgi:general secretion pathway protein I